MEFTLTFLELFFISLYLVLPLLIFLFSIIFIAGWLTSLIEKWPFFDGLYWALITATTVGYGDIRPIHKRSRIFSIFIAFIGLIFTGIIIAVALNTTSITIEKHISSEMIEKIKEKVENQ